MSSRKRGEIKGRESMFAIAEQTGQIVVPDPNKSPYQSDIELSAIHLQNVITHMTAYRRAGQHLRRDRQDARAGRRHSPEKMLQNIEKKRQEDRIKAKTEFLKATGLVELMDAGKYTKREVQQSARKMYELFMEKHFGPKSTYQSRQAYRRQLASEVSRIQERKVTESNRQQGLRPHKVEQPIRRIKTYEDSLDTRGRLKAIQNDPRAGFLPTTHREKNQVLTFLDYLDNPEYPLGVSNQLIEVYNKAVTNQRENETIDTKRGPLSVTYEFTDYLHNSIEQLAALEQIRPSVVTLPNSRVTLADETEWVDLNHPGFKALARYVDLSKFKDTGETPIFDLLRTREIDRDNTKAKHKTIGDIYTSEPSGNKAQEQRTYLEDRIRTMLVGEARGNIDAAIEDQARRGSFMFKRLGEIATVEMPDTLSRMLERPRQVAAETIASVGID